jgi:hypothetical protein
MIKAYAKVANDIVTQKQLLLPLMKTYHTMLVVVEIVFI